VCVCLWLFLWVQCTPGSLGGARLIQQATALGQEDVWGAAHSSNSTRAAAARSAVGTASSVAAQNARAGRPSGRPLWWCASDWQTDRQRDRLCALGLGLPSGDPRHARLERNRHCRWLPLVTQSAERAREQTLNKASPSR